MEEQSVKQCCATFYGSDFARFLLGDSLHPGGMELTRYLGELLGLTPQSNVLDVASGRGTSAFHLAESFSCRVTGVDLSEENLHVATAEAGQRGLADLISFQLGDAEQLPFCNGVFDAIICECAFCTFPSKRVAAQEFYRVLKPGGLLGLSDLTRTEENIPGLKGLLAWIACIGDALPVERYAETLQQAGLQVLSVEDRSGALLEMVRQIQGKLLGAELLSKLKKMDLPDVDFSTAKEFAQAALQATRTGELGYTVIVSKK